MPNPIYGRKLALLTRGEDDVLQVDTGVVTFLHSDLLLDRGRRKPPVRLRCAWMSRIELVSGALKSRLGDAELMLSLNRSELTEQELASFA